MVKTVCNFFFNFFIKYFLKWFINISLDFTFMVLSLFIFLNSLFIFLKTHVYFLFFGIITVNPPELWSDCTLSTRGIKLITLPPCTSIYIYIYIVLFLFFCLFVWFFMKIWWGFDLAYKISLQDYFKMHVKFFIILFLVIENIINIETENSTALEPGPVNSLLHPGPIRSTYILVSYLQNLHY